MNFLVLPVLLAFAASTQAEALNVSVYYESLCPDSKRFITVQLAWGRMFFSEYLNIDLVPYGNADITNSSDGTLNFTCQHGPNECYGNEIHGCAIEVKPESGVEFVTCAMDSDDASDDDNLKLCAWESGIEWDDIQQCMNSGEAEEIFVRNGLRTEAMNINYVPTIVFNGVYNATLQELGENNFLKAICVLYNYEIPNCTY